MPTLEVSYQDFRSLLRKDVSLKELQDVGFLFAKVEVDEVHDDTLKLDCKDSNRPDLWSAEGIARELRGHYDVESGVPTYDIKKSDFKLIVDPSVKDKRPFIVGALVKDFAVTDEFIKQIVQLQEKVCMTFGRKRKEVALGLYDLDKITQPMHYRAVDPRSVSFQPLEFPNELPLIDILELHPKGREYGHLIKDFDKYPLVVDDKDVVASMPPIINSDHTGKITEQTKNLFIEVTGHHLRTLSTALEVLVSAIADRGGDIYSIEVVYENKTITTPVFSTERIEIDPALVKKYGLNLNNEEICSLLKKARYNPTIKNGKIICEYPSYRQDIMHPVDVVEDIIIAYGYNSIEPIPPQLLTRGSILPIEEFKNKVTEFLVGHGAQEISTFSLTNKNDVLLRMGLDDEDIVEIENPVSSNWSVLRHWLFPSIMEFFEKNKMVSYPQQIFEIGEVVIVDESKETKTRNPNKLCWSYAAETADYTRARQVLDALLEALFVSYSIKATSHPSFLPGRTASIKVGSKEIGFIGELHPQILENWGLEFPTVGFELNLTELFNVLRNV